VAHECTLRTLAAAAIGPIVEPMTNALHPLPQSAGLDWQAADSLDLPVPPVVDHKNPIPVRVLANAELCNTAKVIDECIQAAGPAALAANVDITVSSYGNIPIHRYSALSPDQCTSLLAYTSSKGAHACFPLLWAVLCVVYHGPE
jgi:hypothetical protein